MTIVLVQRLFATYLAMEVKKRIEQLDFLYKKIMDMHLNCMSLVWKEQQYLESIRMLAERTGAGSVTVEKSDERREIDKLMFEIELLTESFYYLAGRMRTILTHSSKPLPGLHRFECVGARNVRNKLLEHAEGPDSRIFLQSFAVGGDQGPTLKVERPAGQENIFPDAGLEANASEIKDSLDRLLDRILT